MQLITSSHRFRGSYSFLCVCLLSLALLEIIPCGFVSRDVIASQQGQSLGLNTGSNLTNQVLPTSTSLSGTEPTNSWPSLVLDSPQTLQLLVADLIYSRSNGRVYASVPDGASNRANTVTPINPFTGAMESAIAVGTNPGKMALSDDGRYLYVISSNANQVECVDLTTKKHLKGKYP